MTDRFAPKADYDDSEYIRIQREPRQHTKIHVRVRLHIRTPDIHNHVLCAADFACHQSAGFGSAGTAWKNQYIVSDTNTPVLPTISHELHFTPPS